MLYNQESLPNYIKTAGKITVVTAITGLLVFIVAFMFDTGHREFSRVLAQTASTTLTVLNTPPEFTVLPYEVVESSVDNPTNSGTVIQWSAVGTDSNDAPYFLLVCSTNASPTAKEAAGPAFLGTAPPECGAGAIQWGVSASTSSGELATVSTTTTEGLPFLEQNDWYAWVCDDDPFNPECNVTPSQGIYATSSSPFFVNKRPVLDNFYNNGPADPGANLTFFSTSTDPDSVGGEDDIFLVVCQSNSFNTSTLTCTDPADFLASTTVGVTEHATAVFTLPTPLPDDQYEAFAFIFDEHGHMANANGFNEDYFVNNVTPVVTSGDIILNNGADLAITVPGGETTGFRLDFKVKDANSCENADDGPEITGFVASVFRTSIGTTTCDGTSGSYNPNNCYPSGSAPVTWNLSCVATSTCAGPTQDYVDYACTFPLWFVAEPTMDGAVNIPALLEGDSWSAAVAGIDDGVNWDPGINSATGSMSISQIPREVTLLTALDLLTAEIPYGSLKPGQDSGTLNATTTILAVGNTGLDQEVTGEAMCDSFAVGNECQSSATSTIDDFYQQFAASQLAYDRTATNPDIGLLSSTTAKEVELNVRKSTTTVEATLSKGLTYWGIWVPGTITKAGNYSGLNTFTAVTADAVDWF
jgi:hypothetical protein